MKMSNDISAGTQVLPLQRSILADDVYEAVKALIMDHVVEPGGRIGIEQLSRDLAVSPTPIREALARLEAERLVRKEPLKGYRASDLLSDAALNDLFQFRLQIEPWAASQAARLLSDESRVALQSELATSIKHPAGIGYSDYQNLTAHDERFHRLIFGAAQNVHAARAHEDLHVHLHLFRLHFQTLLVNPTIDEHQAIGRAVLEGRAQAAATAMTNHLEDARLRLLDPNRPPLLKGNNA